MGLCAPLFGQLDYSVNDGDWNSGSTWFVSNIPDSSGETGLITGDNTVNFLAGDVFTVGALSIGHSSANPGTGTLIMTGGTLTVDDGFGHGPFNIGESRGATFTQSAGTLNVTGSLTLGYYYTSPGEAMVWNFSGGSAVVTGDVEIGRFEQAQPSTQVAANAAINQSGSSSLTVGGSLNIGSVNSNGSSYLYSYTLGSGAQLTVSGDIHGNDFGTRVFTFDGGTLASTVSHNIDAGFIANLDHVFVETGGATIDTSGGHLLIASNLEHYAIATDGGLHKIGLNNLTLTGGNTYDGGTTITAGTLVAAGGFGGDSSLGTGAVTVNSGGTLAGNDFITGAVTIESGGHLAPGDPNGPSTGVLRFDGGLTLDDGAVLDFALGGRTPTFLTMGVGQLLTGTSGTNSGDITVNLSDFGDFTAGTYTLFDFSQGSATDVEAGDFVLGTTISGYIFNLAINGSELDVTASAIPEPSTYAMLASLGALGFVLLRRRNART